MYHLCPVSHSVSLCVPSITVYPPVSRQSSDRVDLGRPQLGTLGAGNHYAEIQVVDEIYDPWAAGKMGVEFKGQVCVMIHSGSRGFGHQVATGEWCPNGTAVLFLSSRSVSPPSGALVGSVRCPVR